MSRRLDQARHCNSRKTRTKDDVAASWSPDGGEIAFLRDQGNGHFYVMLIPALGGPERKLSDIFVPDIEWMPGPI
jgi:hypothetical protein